MSGDLLELEPDDDLALEPDEFEPDSTVATQTATVAAAAAPHGLVEILPADFRLPALIKFIPNPALKIAAEDAASYALGLTVEGAEGLQRADLALSVLRGNLKAIEEHFEDPTAIANALHKRLTSVRSEWCASGKAAVETVGRRMYTEQKRLEQIAAEERRKAQDEADRQAREAARREAEEAAKAQAPAPIVEELERQAKTATAPPVATPSTYVAPGLKGNSTVERWKARPAGTPASDEPNPEMAKLSPAQRTKVFELMRAVLDGKAPLVLFDLNWSELNRRASAEKSTFAIPGFEAFDAGGMRAKGSRTK